MLVSDVRWNTPYPERPLGPAQAVTKTGTKGHEDDGETITNVLKESAWAAISSTRTASSPLLWRTRRLMPINQIPRCRLVDAVVSRVRGLPEDARIAIRSHFLVYAVLRDGH